MRAEYSATLYLNDMFYINSYSAVVVIDLPQCGKNSPLFKVKAVAAREGANAVVERNRQAVRDYVERELKKLGMSQLVCDLTYAPYLCGCENPYDEIVNISNHITNALRAGWSLFFEAERLHRELVALKGRPIEACDYEILE